jgi:hypothetical protein
MAVRRIQAQALSQAGRAVRTGMQGEPPLRCVSPLLPAVRACELHMDAFSQDMLFFDDEPYSNMEVTTLGVTFVDAEVRHALFHPTLRFARSQLTQSCHTTVWS